MIKVLCKNIVLLCAFLLISCNSLKRSYPETLDYCEQYIEDQDINIYYRVDFVVDGDTLRGCIDTGSSRTLISGAKYLSREDLLSKVSVLDAYDSIIHLRQLKITDFFWGDVHLQGMVVLVNNLARESYHLKGNVIGLDVLGESIVQFDHESNLVKLSQNRQKLKPRGIRVPCRFDDKNRVFVPIKFSNGETLDFLLDTGFSGELRVGTDSYKIAHSFRQPLRWKTLKSEQVSIQKFSLCDISLAGKTYPNSCLLLTNTGDNLLGVEFLKRYKTVTIDYINKELYFEFPEECIFPELGEMSFSNDTIYNVSLYYLHNIYQVYNTYGFFVERQDSIFQVVRVDPDVEDGGLQLGDTLIGVNHRIFTDKYVKSLRMQDNLKSCIDRREQDVVLGNVMTQHNEGTFYFLKDGMPYTLNRQRKEYLREVPPYGYTYAPNPMRVDGIGLMLYKDIKARKLSIHIPWAPLIGGRVIELDGEDDKGNNVSLSNRPSRATLE